MFLGLSMNPPGIQQFIVLLIKHNQQKYLSKHFILQNTNKTSIIATILIYQLNQGFRWIKLSELDMKSLINTHLLSGRAYYKTLLGKPLLIHMRYSTRCHMLQVVKT